MRHFISEVKLFLMHSYYAYRALFTWLTPRDYLILKILEPTSQVIFFALLGRQVGRDPSYFVIGNSVRLAAISGIFGVIQVIVTERRMGTLPHLIITPTSNAISFFGRGLVLIFDGLISIAAGFIIGALLFGLDFSHVSWLWLSIALLTTSFAVSTLGLVLGVMGFVGTDLNLVLNIMLGLLLVMCGVNFPVSELPVAIQWLSFALPLTHGLMAVRTIFSGNIVIVPGLIALEGFIGCIYMLIGYGAFAFFERRARQKGSWELG